MTVEFFGPIRETPNVSRHGATRTRQCAICGHREHVYDPLPDPDDVLPSPRRVLSPTVHICTRAEGHYAVHWPMVEPDLR